MISSSDILHAKVLIVDNEEVSALLLERLLRGAGYVSITSTTDPGEVCALHRKNGYDLILLDEDTVARLGVDGFVIALWHVSGPDYATTVALKVIEAVSQPYVLEGQTVNVTTSACIGIYPIHGEDADTLMKNADLALYEAKHAGRNAYRMAERTDLSTQTHSSNKS
jgi:PleD family two-component response regulator